MRYFATTLPALLIFVLTFSASFAAFAKQPPQYSANKDYITISPAVQSAQGADKVRVVEFFWYGCPHCYTFAPLMENWRKTVADNVEVIRVPAVFNKGWIPHAQAYYAAEQLGILEKVHMAIFQQIHVQRNNLHSQQALATFIGARAGIDKQQVLNAMNSFEVSNKVRLAMEMVRGSRLQGVPAVVVNGKYLTSGRYVKTNREVLKVIDFLVAKEQ